MKNFLRNKTILVSLLVFLILEMVFVFHILSTFSYVKTVQDTTLDVTVSEKDIQRIAFDTNRNNYSLFVDGKTDAYLWMFSEVKERGEYLEIYKLSQGEKLSLVDKLSLSKGQMVEEIDGNALERGQYFISFPTSVPVIQVSSARIDQITNTKKIIVLFVIESIFSIMCATLFYFILKERKTFLNRINNVLSGLSSKRLFLFIFTVLISLALGFAGNYILHLRYGTTIGIKVILCCAIVIMILLILSTLVLKKKCPTLKGMVAVIFLISAIFSIGEPISVGVSYDDVIHYKNILNAGNCITGEASYSDWILTSDDYYYPTAAYHLGYDKSTNLGKSKLFDQIDRLNYKIPTDGGVSYVSIGYTQYIIVYLLLKIFPFSWTIKFVLLRLAGTVSFTLFALLSMKKMEDKVFPIFVISMIPGLMFLTANFSYDSFIISMIMYSFASYYKEYYSGKENLSVGALFHIYVPLVAACVVKPVYFPIVCLYITFLQDKNKNRDNFKKSLLFIGMSFVITLLILKFTGDKWSSNAPDSRLYDGVDPSGQFRYVLCHPLSVMIVLLKFLKDYLNPFGYKGGYGCTNFMANMGTSRFPGFIMIFVIIAILLDDGYNGKKSPLLLSRIAIVVAYVISAIGSCMALYISFVPVGANFVSGVQPRYLFPLLLPLLVFLTDGLGRYAGKIVRLVKKELFYSFSMAIMIIANVFAIMSLCLRYY